MYLREERERARRNVNEKEKMKEINNPIEIYAKWQIFMLSNSNSHVYHQTFIKEMTVSTTQHIMKWLLYVQITEMIS